ncbi:unnamed protein product, partial [Meganyctiphanes norvegica]
KGHALEVQQALQDAEDPNTTMPYKLPVLWGRPAKSGRFWGGQLDKAPVLLVAVVKNDIWVVKALLKAKVDTEFRGDCFATPLSYAARLGHTRLVEQLLNHGANVNAKDSKWGSIPIHSAASRGSVRIMQMLGAKGSPIGPRDFVGDTPLHEAAYYGRNGACQWLVSQGADVLAVSNTEESAAEYAASRGHKEVSGWLRSFEANVAAARS